jgi:hypothetical protein
MPREMRVDLSVNLETCFTRTAIINEIRRAEFTYVRDEVSLASSSAAQVALPLDWPALAIRI